MASRKPAAKKAAARKAAPKTAPKPARKPSGVSRGAPAQAEERKRGRPTDYRPEYAEQAYKFCLLGATDADLARMFEVAESTINLWKQEHPGFSESIKRGKEIADAEVSERLFLRAKGFEHDDVDIRAVASGGGVSEIVQTPIRKVYPPDTAAAIFWLKNRQKDRWRDRLEHGHGGLPGAPPIATAQIDVSKMTLDQQYAYVMNGGTLPEPPKEAEE